MAPSLLFAHFTQMDTLLTDEQLADAIRYRVQDRLYWEQIAGKLGVERKTLYNARQTKRWEQIALAIVNEIKGEALPVAWQGLLDAAALKDVAACKEILNRVDEVVEQTVNVKHSGEVEINDNEYAALLEELAGISTDGASREGGPDPKAQ